MSGQSGQTSRGLALPVVWDESKGLPETHLGMVCLNGSAECFQSLSYSCYANQCYQRLAATRLERPVSVVSEVSDFLSAALASCARTYHVRHRIRRRWGFRYAEKKSLTSPT
jgi:hypothetical protein